MKNCGVYKILNTANGKTYIGSSQNIKARWAEHRRDLEQGKHSNRYLQNSYNKHGVNAFSFSVLLLCAKADLVLYEQICLDHYKPELNLSPTAYSNAGMKYPDWVCDKISAALKGKPKSERAKENYRKAWLTRPEFSTETRRRMSVSHLGLQKSEQTKEKLRQANTKLSKDDIWAVRDLVSKGVERKLVGKMFCIHVSTISLIVRAEGRFSRG